jgi:quercetin dioxygenase-like cupin family protein
MAEPNPDLKPCQVDYIFEYGEKNFIRYSGNRGEGLPKHSHGEHFVMVALGKVCVRKENIYKELSADDLPVVLAANEWHEIEILEDNTVFINSGK